MILNPDRVLFEISDAASYLAPISEADRACKYPYQAPDGGFVLSNGRVLRLDQALLNQLDDDQNRGILAGRTPVLSVGSNRAPLQLRPGLVFGYAACAGALDCGDDKPAGLDAILAQGRKFKTLNQAEANARLRYLAKVDDDRSMLQFIAEMQSDKQARIKIIKSLLPYAIQPQSPPWKMQAVKIDGLDAYL